MAREARRPRRGSFIIRTAARRVRGTYRAAHGMLATGRQARLSDNAVAGSLISTSEFYLLIRHDWHTMEEPRRAIGRQIETCFDRNPRHSARATSVTRSLQWNLEAA